MSNIQQRKELALKAINLINEFIDESSLIAEYYFRDIAPNEDFTAITYFDDEGQNEYSLDYVSGFFKIDMEGFGPCGAQFDEAVDMAISDLEYDFKKFKSKEDYIKYAGGLYYMKIRCEQIYKELKAIDDEASSIMD